MSRVTELEKALTTLFRKGTEVGYTETEIDEFLENIDYHALLQAVWNKAETVYANHTLALDELSEEAASIPAVDVCMEQAHDRAEAIHRSVRKVTQIRKHLTDTQFRRVWMYFVDGMTVDEIGAAEGVSHQNISKSIGAAMKKMKKLFPDC